MTSQPEAQKLMCPLGCGGMTENTSTQAMPLLTVCASEPAPVRTDGRALRAAGARVHAQRCLQAVMYAILGTKLGAYRILLGTPTEQLPNRHATVHVPLHDSTAP